MTHIFKLENQVKHYDWGDVDWIPSLLGKANPEKRPWAELWMGVHAEGPSQVDEGGRRVPLPALIEQAPRLYLGEAVERTFGTLPFLFKILAAGKPLSIQAHPDLAQAAAGYQRETEADIPLAAPNRNYKDANHKPEILCALTPFMAMCGFRHAAAIEQRMTAFAHTASGVLKTAFEALCVHLWNSDERAALRDFLKALLELPLDTRQALSAYAAATPPSDRETRLVAHFAQLYPNDPAIIAPFYLNVIELRPGEAVYLPAGVLHAYISGLGVELMANSNNVLRGGLTPKYVDVAELLSILRFSAFKPQILTPQGITYQTPCREFALSVLRNDAGALSFSEQGPAIVIVTEGAALISCSNGEETCALAQGEAAFIAAHDQNVTISGTYTLYSAAANLHAF
ncbi:MAG: mannose-6-phosphate isomerase, class I [Treponema sp.]|jgi:mannose-6-phosphate isomerase|nr:mannose-6-phosphate isomerase, class I [Treponema sp.]